MFGCWWEVAVCGALSVLYVASLYVWDSSKGRDDPSTIAKRSLSVLVMSFVSPLTVHLTLRRGGRYFAGGLSLWEVLGVLGAGLLNAILLPSLLTCLFYAGHLGFWLSRGTLCWHPVYVARLLRSPVWLRNQVIAPFSEEWTFRACLVPMLAQCLAPPTVLWAAPLFFGVAHLHHAIGRLRVGEPPLQVLTRAGFQCIFTSVFGMYSAYLFMKTGHFAATFTTHALCNLFGLPEVEEILRLPSPGQRWGFLALHLAGFLLWGLSLPYITAGCHYSPVVNYLPDL